MSCPLFFAIMKSVINMKKSFNKILIWCFVSSVAAVGLFLLIMAVAGVYPFGSLSVAKSDAIYQYIPFFSEFSQRIKEGASLLYSWNNGGQNFLGTVCYYLVNPFNLVCVFFGKDNTLSAYLTVIILNTCAIAFSMAYYLQKHFNKSGIHTVLFSLLYTFSGFYIAYYYNTMWLMALICLPIIALGIEKITEGKSAFTYLAALTVCIVSNFYLGYMICIFSVLYFFVCLFSQDINSKDDENRVALSSVLMKFAGSSLLSGLLSAITLIPIIYCLSGAYVKNVFNDDGGLFFGLGEFLRVHLPGIIPNEILPTASTYPPVMLGSFALLLLPMYAFTKKISKNEKASHIILAVLLAFSFAVPKVYYLWHGMSAPAGLPYRFAFIYLFVLVKLAYCVFENIKDAGKLTTVISAVAVGAVYVYSFATLDETYSRQLLIGAVTSFVSFVLIAIAVFVKKSKVQLISALALAVTVAEISLTCSGVFAAVPKDDLYKESENALQASEIISKDSDAEFIRSEFADTKNIMLDGKKGYSLNSGSIYSLNGISSFSSLVDSDYAMMQFDMGLAGNMGNAYAYTAQTPIYNTLFAMDYVIDNANALESNPYYEYVGSTDDYEVYKTVKSANFGILANSEVKQWDGYNSNPLNSQNTFWESITGVKDTITLIEPDEIKAVDCEFVSQSELKAAAGDEGEVHIHSHGEESSSTTQNVYDLLDSITGLYAYNINSSDYSIEISFTSEKTQNVYLVAQSGIADNVTVRKSTDGNTNTFGFESKRIIDIGVCQAGETVDLIFKAYEGFDMNSLDDSSEVSDSLMCVIGALDSEAFEKSEQALGSNGVLTMTSFEEDKMSFSATVNKDSVCLMPMAYDEGWSVTVDGEEVELYEHSSHILMFDLTQGEHQIEMKYFPQGLKEGIFVSVCSLLILALVILLIKVRKMKDSLPEKENTKPEKDD